MSAQNILMFRFCNSTLYAKTLFTKEGRSNLMNELSEKGPFQCIITDELDIKVANLVIVPRICLKHSCEKYSKMDLCKLQTNFSNLPQVAKNRRLNENQPLAVSFVNADESTFIDL